MPSLALAKSRVLANVAGLTTTFFDLVREEMFGSGEQGIYMPSVHESFLRGDLYQDAAGTTPVTAAGQSVGLWLERSKGLVRGPDEIADAVEVNYGATTSNVDGKIVFTESPVSARVRYGTLDVSKGSRWLETIIDIESIASGSLRVQVGGGAFALSSASTPGVHRQIAYLTPTDNGIYFQAGTNGTSAVVRSITVRELPGNHASQPTAASCPTLEQDANGMYVLRFDGVDDFMQSPFAPGDYPLHLLAGSDYPEGGGEGGIISVSSPTLDSQYKCLGRVSPPMQVRAEARYGIDRSINNPTTTDTRTVSSAAISESYVALRVNGADKGDITNTAAWNDASTAFIGKTRPSGLFLNGDIYGLIVVGAEKSLAQIELAENLINRYTRAY